MKSMNLIGGRCQAVPDREHGVVFGLDIGKDTITYRACRPEMAGKPRIVSQDMAGFRKIVAAMEDYAERGYEVWVGYEPTGAYSCCVCEFLIEGDWKVVQVNPKHTSRYNDIMDNKPGKSDPRDPRGIAGLIWQGCYRTPLHLTGAYAELRAASANWAMLAGESTRLRNQLHSMMQLWCPEIGVVFKDALCKSVRAIVRKYRSSDEIAKAGARRVGSVLAKARPRHNNKPCRGSDRGSSRDHSSFERPEDAPPFDAKPLGPTRAGGEAEGTVEGGYGEDVGNVAGITPYPERKRHGNRDLCQHHGRVR